MMEFLFSFNFRNLIVFGWRFYEIYHAIFCSDPTNIQLMLHKVGRRESFYLFLGTVLLFWRQMVTMTSSFLPASIITKVFPHFQFRLSRFWSRPMEAFYIYSTLAILHFSLNVTIIYVVVSKAFSDHSKKISSGILI